MSELDTFKAELRAAGEPWRRYGIWGVGAGIVVLAIAQFAGQAYPTPLVFFSILGPALVLIAAGWAFLVVAFIRQRRWAKAHPVESVQLPELS